MLNKVSSLARAAAVVLAVVAAFVTIGALNTGLVLVALGLIAGLSAGDESIIRLGITVVALPAVGAALTTIPGIGEKLGAVANNLALAIAGSLATSITLMIFNRLKGDVAGFTAKT